MGTRNEVTLYWSSTTAVIPTCTGGDDSYSGGLKKNEAVTDISHPYLDSRRGGKEAGKTSCKLFISHGLLCSRASNLGGEEEGW